MSDARAPVRPRDREPGRVKRADGLGPRKNAFRPIAAAQKQRVHLPHAQVALHLFEIDRNSLADKPGKRRVLKGHLAECVIDQTQLALKRGLRLLQRAVRPEQRAQPADLFHRVSVQRQIADGGKVVRPIRQTVDDRRTLQPQTADSGYRHMSPIRKRRLRPRPVHPIDRHVCRNILETEAADRLECKARIVPRQREDLCRNADFAHACHRFQPCRYIDCVAIDIALPKDDLADMRPGPEAGLFVQCAWQVRDSSLHVKRIVQRIGSRVEQHQCPVTRGLDKLAAMFGTTVLKHQKSRLQKIHCLLLARAHQSARIHEVEEQYSLEAGFLFRCARHMLAFPRFRRPGGNTT